MKEELYIKGEAVDLGDAQITLNFKSNLLGDISEITASNSYTIELPRTLKNERLLEFPDVAGHNNYLARDYFDAQYFRNGIKVLDAKAVITSSSSDGFAIALTWGIDERLTNIINDDRSIQEFADEYFDWNKNSKYDNGVTTSGEPKNGYIRHNAGVSIDLNRDSIFIHPSASVRVLLDKIEAEFGFPLEFPADIDDKIDKLYIPAITQESDPKYNYFDAPVTGFITSGSTNYVAISQSNYVNGCVQGNYGPDNRGIIDIDDTSEPWNLDFTFQGNAPYLNISFYDGSSAITSVRLAPDETGTFTYSGSLPSAVTLTHESCRIWFTFPTGYSINTGRVTVKNPDIDEEITYGQRFSLGKNLPDISVLDLLKSLCWLYGLFAVKSTTGVRFVPVTIYQENRGKAVDWSKKLVPAGRTAKETTYQFGDFAQKNYLRYKENENAKSADGYIEVQNKFLERETDLVELPFTAGRDKDNYNLVPYFEYDDDGQVDTVDCGARLMTKETKRNGEVWLTFENLDFETLLFAPYYEAYKQLIKAPFVIVDDFRLNDIDLKNLDMTVPVYIQQYGAFFAIVEIQTQGEISEVELLKLK